MFCLFVAKLRLILICMRKYDVNQANDLRNRLHIHRFHFFFRKISPDTVEITSRRSIGYVLML